MDVTLRIVTVTLLLMMALGVIMRPQPWRWALCFIAVALGVSAFVVSNASSDILTPTLWSGPWVVTNFLGKMIVIFVWLFVQCSFDDEFRFDRFRVTVSLGWVALVLHGIWRLRTGIDDPFGFASVIFALMLMGHLIWTLLHDREGDLRLQRRAARIWVSVIMVSLLLIDLIIDLIMGFSWQPASFIYLQNGLILLAVLVLAAAILRIDNSKLAPKPHTLDVLGQQWTGPAAELNQIMATEQLYLRPDLRLSDVVDRLPISEAATRSLINQEFGHGHFRSFLNYYRVKHAQDLLRSPGHNTSKLIAIAFDSGFASLASFQRAFKRATGLTASQWRQKQKFD